MSPKTATKAEPKTGAKETKPRKASTKPRVTQKLTMSQTKIVEGRFDTTRATVEKLAAALTDIEAKWDEEQRDSFVPKQVAQARQSLVDALAFIDKAKGEFALIGEQYRSFFG